MSIATAVQAVFGGGRRALKKQTEGSRRTRRADATIGAFEDSSTFSLRFKDQLRQLEESTEARFSAVSRPR